ncbi:hypothetical protein RFI_20967, partial [Reticulomyxa filosa]
MAEYENLTYEEGLKKYLLYPLGLNNSGVTPTSQQLAHAATGYNQYTQQPYGFSNLGWEAPAGQIFSTVGDLATLLGQFLLAVPSKYSLSLGSPKQLILAPQTLREMLRPVSYSPDMQSAYGSPWEMQVVSGHLVRSKGGNVNGFSASVALVPEMRLGVIGLTNAQIDGSMLTLSNLEILIPAFAGWLATQQSVMSPNYPTNVQSQLGIYGGSYQLSRIKQSVIAMSYNIFICYIIYICYIYIFFFSCLVNSFIRSRINGYAGTISTQAINDIQWLVLFVTAPAIQNFALIYQSSDTKANTQTFVLVNLQDEVFSCWQTTLASIDGGHVIFQLNDNDTQVLSFTDPDSNPFDPFYKISFVED